MPSPPFRPVPPGGRPSAREANRLGAIAAGSTNATGGASAGGLAASSFGTHLVPGPKETMLARITGYAVDEGYVGATGCEYHLYECLDDDHCLLEFRDGVSMALTEANTASAPNFPAYEANGCRAGIGAVVRLFRGNGNWWNFLRPVECATESGSSGFSGFESGDSGNGDDIFIDDGFELLGGGTGGGGGSTGGGTPGTGTGGVGG